MRPLQFRTRTLLLTVAIFALWISVFHLVKIFTLFGCLCCLPLFISYVYIAIINLFLPDGPDEETKTLVRWYLWVSLSGVVALFLALAIDGFPFRDV
jgi:hypothetical protein